MNKKQNTRPPIESLACVNAECELYGQKGQGNLIIRKEYGKGRIRYLRCRCCREEFSERKNTALWNSKIPEEQAIAVAEHLAEGCSFKGTARLVKIDPETVRRLNRRLGKHGKQYHEQEVQEVDVTTLQADERHGFAGKKQQVIWEAELMDPQSKFILSHVQGRRDDDLIRRLFQDGARRVVDRHSIALFTDGLPTYRALFPQIFGRPYRPARQGKRGRLPSLRYHIPRGTAHIQIIKHRQGRRLTEVEIRLAHGSLKRIRQALAELGYHLPNTSAIERRNGTARLMNRSQTRKSLAFPRRPDTKFAQGWWGLTVYNWCRPHRSLKLPLPQLVGKKSTNNVPRPWLLV